MHSLLKKRIGEIQCLCEDYLSDTKNDRLVALINDRIEALSTLVSDKTTYDKDIRDLSESIPKWSINEIKLIPRTLKEKTISLLFCLVTVPVIAAIVKNSGEAIERVIENVKYSDKHRKKVRDKALIKISKVLKLTRNMLSAIGSRSRTTGSKWLSVKSRGVASIYNEYTTQKQH